MIAVIIAGGSGSRLWPLSTNDYPKQLLKLTNEYSMVQNTYQRAKRISKNIYVIPDISHADHIKNQLTDLSTDHFVVEPGRRGTANCIVAALAHISILCRADEPIAFMHTDHHIRDIDGFAQSFNLAAEVSASKKQIVLVGIEPSYPATGFGYIERDGDIAGFGGVHKVESFKEKPDFITAKQYMASGRHLWNCGYFVGSLNTFLKEMKTRAPDLLTRYEKLVKLSSDSKEYAKTYASFENDSIDYALIEKSKNLLVVPASFDWMDVGSFKDLHEANESDELGNYIHGDNIHILELENAYIRNEEDKPIAVIGLDNVVIVNTPDGILVARKDLSQKVGEIAKKIQK